MNLTILESGIGSGGLFLGDMNRPPRSLLEASSRKVVRNIEQGIRAKQDEKKTSGKMVCMQFTEAYTTALRNGNIKWASNQTVSELFHQDAKLITHDKQTFIGLTAIIRRLNAGQSTSRKHQVIVL